MNIVIVGTAHPLRGGLATFNERLALELQNEGHQVKIYSFTLQYPNFLFPGKTQYTEEAAPKTLQITSLVNSVNPLNWIRVGKRLRKEKPDLIIFRYWLPFFGPAFGTIAKIAKKNQHTKVISILDNVIPHEKRIGDQLFTKYYLSKIDAFIAMSHSVLNDLRTFIPKPNAVFSPHPVYDNFGPAYPKSTALAALDIPNHDKIILFFGFIRKYKGLDILLEAITDQRIKDMGIKLLVAGEYYGDKDFYENLIEKLNIQDQLIMRTDFIPNEEVGKYFSVADCVVQPYRTATQSGITQVAYHFEVPMIVTNVGGLPEIVPDEKVGYVAEISSAAIADKIVKFYTENPTAAFKENIIEEKKKYEWKYFTKNLLQLISKNN